MKNIQSVIGKSMTALVIMLLGGAMISQASALVLTHTVDGTDNLYYTDWGHWFTVEGDGALAAYAPGSTAASAVAGNGSVYNFSSWDYLDIAVTGGVTDAGSYVTDADGCPASLTSCIFKDGQFRYQDVYSVIGLWSSSADSITPIDVGSIYGNWIDAVFLVGSNARIDVPDVENAYLFLAENDGIFYDNSGFYTATITAAVPEPASALLLFTSLLSLLVFRRYR